MATVPGNSTSRGGHLERPIKDFMPILPLLLLQRRIRHLEVAHHGNRSWLEGIRLRCEGRLIIVQHAHLVAAPGEQWLIEARREQQYVVRSSDIPQVKTTATHERKRAAAEARKEVEAECS